MTTCYPTLKLCWSFEHFLDSFPKFSNRNHFVLAGAKDLDQLSTASVICLV
jgi:hypothetical protein